MAEGVRFVCRSCGNAMDSWSDGNPYYIDRLGCKQYAYHPNHERLSECIGNDSPQLCLACGAKFLVDSKAPTTRCPKCGAADIVDTYALEGKRCPACKAGVFCLDPDFRSIS
jgi:predicted RNA-binding Zn-ribbon protein involved in translation (DUF1610 family)